MHTQTFTLGSWNLQKGPALEDLAKTNIFAAAARSARSQVLGALTSGCDIVFVQEPPIEIRNETQQIDYGSIETQEQTWISYNASADNQSHTSANRPALYSRVTMQPVVAPSDCPVNGNEDAFRLSAISYACTDIGYMLFVSLHATSGGNAQRNTAAFMDWLSKWVPANFKSVRAVLIGADFNHTPYPLVSQLNGCTLSYQMPGQMTQQSGSILDGFACLVIDPTVTCKWLSVRRMCTGEANSPLVTKMVQVTPNQHQGANSRGYLAQLPTGPLPGTSHVLKGPPMWIRMSDHCAVVGSVELSCPN